MVAVEELGHIFAHDTGSPRPASEPLTEDAHIFLHDTRSNLPLQKEQENSLSVKPKGSAIEATSQS